MSTLSPPEDFDNEGNYSSVEEAVEKMTVERAERAERVVKDLQVFQDSEVSQVIHPSEKADDLDLDLGLELASDSELELESEKSLSDLLTIPDLSQLLLQKSSFNTPLASKKARVLISELLKEQGIDVVGVLPKGLLGEKINLSVETRKRITVVKKKLNKLEDEALEFEVEKSGPVALIKRLDMLLLTNESTITDVKRNILVVQEILRDINSMTKKGYVNSSDILTNLNSDFMSLCISSMITYANKRIIPKTE